MTKPDPCPFCGGLLVSMEVGETFRWRHMQCQECEAKGPSVRIRTLGEGTREEYEKEALERATEAWNERKGMEHGN